MIRSALSAFAVVALCFAIMQVPVGYETLPLPTAAATPPATILPVPDSDELWAAIKQLEDRVELLEKRPQCPCPPVSVVEPPAAPKQAAPQASDVSVTMHTKKGCAPCASFIRDELPQLGDLNIRIVEGGAKAYPTFVIANGERTVTLVGRMSAPGLRYRIREFLSR
jgi:hypothetical protein